jgi:hypothetical protein
MKTSEIKNILATKKMNEREREFWLNRLNVSTESEPEHIYEFEDNIFGKSTIRNLECPICGCSLINNKCNNHSRH